MVSQTSFISVEELVKLAEAQLDNYDRESNPEKRRFNVHNAFAFLYRWINPETFVKEAEGSRLRFSGILGLPRFREDEVFCNDHLTYFE